MCKSSRADYFLFGALLARTGMKRFNLAALLDFPKVIGPNESNSESETSHFSEVWTLRKISMESQMSLSPCKSMGKSLFGPLSHFSGKKCDNYSFTMS